MSLGLNMILYIFLRIRNSVVAVLPRWGKWTNLLPLWGKENFTEFNATDL